MDDDDAIAIVGVGGKFPGADNIEEFWKILVNGENHITEIPPERWNVEAFYDSDPDAVGKTYVRKAGLLKRYDEFDNKLFGISDIEASRMDPQQRYVLECVHMALEDAGIPSSVVKGSNTGVFIGVMNDDYKGMSSDDLATMTNYSLTGTSQSIISARVSYVYNLLGPSMVIDTACSSALVAIDAGIQNLKSGRCSMVICGGVNSIVAPDLFVPLSRARMISPTGQCQAFSANADGYCRGEGCGIVILKRLEEAKRDMNKIWSTIATDCNQDGHTATPITAPSSSQQEELLKRIYSENRVDPGDIQVIEAHGTGTPVGDPVEINTLGRFFMSGLSDPRKDLSKVYVASVKTNIGHLESAAGVASLIKVLLMMKHKTIVPSLHFTVPNQKIEFHKFQFEVPAKSVPWNSPSGMKRIACTNCFGFGGTNAHAIIKEFEHTQSVGKNLNRMHLVFFSHPEESGLRNTLSTMQTSISQNKYNICDVSYTSLCRRDHHDFRVAVIAEDMNDLNSRIEQKITELASDSSTKSKPHRIIAVFCGVGTVFKGMCKKLLEENTLFRDTVLQVDSILQQWTPMSIYDIMVKGEEINDPFTSHIAIFTCQIGLWKLWKSFGLHVDAVVGQSVGEVAGSYASGCLTLEQASKVIYLRSKHLAHVTGGKMIVIGNCKTAHVERVCSHFMGKACIAVHASSKSCVVSCDADVVDEIKQSIRNAIVPEERNDLFLKDLNVKCAYHSHHTEKAGTALEQDLGKLNVSVPSIEVVSSVTGTKADMDIFNHNYWNKNVSKPVLFKPAIMAAGHADKFNIFLEIGPKPVLRPHLTDSFSVHDAVCLSSMEEQDHSRILKTVGKFFEYKVILDWKKLSGIGQICEVPKIPLQPSYKGMYLSDATMLKNHGLGSSLGSHLFVTRTHNKNSMFRVTISEENTPFVYQHFVSNSIVVPGAFYAEVALEVGQILTELRVQDICVNVEFNRPIQISAKKKYFAEVTLDKHSNDFVKGLVKRGSETIASLEVRVPDKILQNDTIDIANVRRECQEIQDSATTYQTLMDLGFSYGRDLKVLGNAIKNESQCLVEIHLSDMIWNDVKRTHLHPAVLDGLLQTPGVLALDSAENGALLPGGIDRLVVRRGVERDMLAYAEISRKTKEYTSYNMALLSLTGVVIAEVKNFKIKYVMETSADQSVEYVQRWKEIDYKTRHISNEHKIIIFSFDAETLKNIEEAISQENKVLSVLLGDATLQEFKTQKPDVFQQIELFQVAFIPRLCMTDSMEGPDVLKKINASCLSMLAIVQILGEKGKYVPVTVITECTQAYDLIKCNHVNLCGSELWGQVRSIVREDPLMDIILLDCHPSIKATTYFIKEVMNKRPVEVGEIVYEDDHIYSNTLHRISIGLKDTIYKDGTLDEQCKLQVKAKKQDDISEPFLVIESPLQMFSGDHEVFELQDIYLHSRDMHTTTIQSDFQSGFRLFDNTEAGLDVLTFEATAIEALDTNAKGIEKAHNSRCADKVILYPMRVQSTVVVPRQCVYSLANLKGYSPGILVKAALMYTLSGKVIKDNALVLYDKQYEVHAKLLLLFLKNVRSCDASMTPILKPTSDVIVMKVLNHKDIQKLTSYKCLKSITTLSCILTHNQKIMIEMKGICVNCLQTEDILNQDTLLSLSPVIQKFLYGNLHEITGSHYTNADPIRNQLNASEKMISLRTQNLKYDTIVKLSKQMLLRKNCCYIVVGGLTGLGWEIVKLLATRGAGEIISISRRCPDAEKDRYMEKISTDFGCRVRSLSADITDWQSVFNVFAEIDRTSSFPVKGIFQGAGILKNALSLQMTENELVEVMKPKVLGTWNLHLISTRYPLDYFVMHSSVTSVFGNIGQSNYGAANSFLDALAHYRQIHNLNGQSINWGPLALGMMKEGSNTANLDEILREQGYISMEKEQICQCLLDAMLNNQVQVMYGIYDWKVLGKALSTVANSIIKYKLRGFLSEKDEMTSPSNVSSQDELLGILKTPPNLWKQKILEIVFTIAGEAFTHDIENLSSMSLIGELGIDSMQVMTFANKIHDIFGIRIPLITFISEETTFDTIVCQLHDKIQENGNTFLKEERKQVTTVLSPIEKRLYDAYVHNPNDPTLSIFADLQLTKRVADPAIWKRILTQVQNRYSTLRTLIQADEKGNEVLKVIFEPQLTKLDFRVLDINELDHVERLPKDMKQILFDPKDFPMRALFAKSAETCMLRLVFNHILIDFASIGTIVNDLLNMYFNKTPENLNVLEVDVFPVFQKHMLRTRSQLISYWKRRTPHQLQSMSLTGIEKDNLDPCQVEAVNNTIPVEIVELLQNAMQFHKVKLSELVISLYHVLLYQQLRSDIIAIFMNMDMRIHFPEYKSYVGRFANLIPLYAEIDESMSLLSIIKMNKQTLSDGLENGLLPFHDIIECIEGITPSNVHRHQISIDYQRDMDESLDRLQNIKLKRMVTGNFYMETQLLVWYNLEKKYLNFELAYNSSTVNNDLAKAMVEMIGKILAIFVEKPATTVVEILDVHNNRTKSHKSTNQVDNQRCQSQDKEQRKSEQNHNQQNEDLEDSEKNNPAGLFMKRTQGGWTHPVWLTIVGKGQECRLVWGKNQNAAMKTMYFTEIKEISLVESAGTHVMNISGQNRNYTFTTADTKVIGRFKTFISKFSGDN